MDYSEISDFDINRMVGDVVFKGLWSCKPGTAGNDSESWHYGNADTSLNPLSALPDYCNKPADAWPIVESNLIRLTPIAHSGEVIWVASRDIHAHCNAKPFRAAMIVFLMMQEG